MPTPNPTTRREFKGAAAATTLQNSMTNSDISFVLVSNTNWPTGAVGKFIVTINRGQADEEKILCDTQSARTVACLLANRGFDGTTAQSHSAGATVECTISAFDADEWNQHTNATTGVHGVAGSVVGTTDTQTLTNKTFDGTSVVSGGGALVGASSTQSVTNKALLSGQQLQVSVAAATDADVQFVQNSAIKADIAIAGAAGHYATGSVAGDLVIRSNGGTLFLSGDNGVTTPIKITGSALSIVGVTDAWTAYTPTFTNCTSATGVFKYLLTGKTLQLHANFTGGTATGAGAIAFSVPASLSAFTIGVAGGIGLTGTITTMAWTASVGAVTSGTAFTAGQSLNNVWANGTIEVA